MKVAIASDHGGVHIRNEIKELMDELQIEYIDMGCDCGSGSVDYPDYAFPVAEKVVSGEVDRGILICGTGIGMSISANKVKGFAARWRTIPSARRRRGSIMTQTSLRWVNG